MKKSVFVLYGGKSAEHEVSIDSALNVLNELNKDTYDVFAVYITQDGRWNDPFQVGKGILKRQQLLRETGVELRASVSRFFQHYPNDESIVFPVLHGTYGEDGTLQGMLEMMNVAYVGNGVVASSAGMDKVVSKNIFADYNLPQTPYVDFTQSLFEHHEQDYIHLVQDEIGFPCYVKPANMGSSIGITHCKTNLQLKEAIATAFLFDEKVIVEREVDGKEVIVGVTGNGHTLTCSLAGEWKREQQFFAYEYKYLDEHFTPLIPAMIDDETYKKISHYAKMAYMALGGAGLMRIDFFVTDEQEVYINEVNTLPGFTKYSMFPVLFERTKSLSYTDLLDHLINLGYEAYTERNRLQYRRVHV